MNAPDHTDIEGESYSGLFVRADRATVLDQLSERRFTGSVGPQEGEWVLAVPEKAKGAVAGSGRELTILGVELAAELSTVTLVARVERDRVLRLDGWDGSGAESTEPAELGSYLNDPTVDAPDPDEVWPEPEGAHHAHDYARAVGRPEVGEDLAELLGEELDHESTLESERLDSVLRMLDLPRWLVAAGSLPRDVPGGPRRNEFTHLGAGTAGGAGVVRGAVAGVLRKRHR